VLYIHGKRKCVYMRTTGASSSTTSNGHWRRIVRRGSRRAHAHATSGRNVVTFRRFRQRTHLSFIMRS
jgi:hypothetical protein